MKKALATIAVTLVLAPAASADPFKVKVDQSISVKLSSAPASIVIGNPAVANVAILTADTLLITGKKSGATNIVVLDQSGHVIWKNEIAVRALPVAKLYPARAA